MGRPRRVLRHRAAKPRPRAARRPSARGRPQPPGHAASETTRAPRRAGVRARATRQRTARVVPAGRAPFCFGGPSATSHPRASYHGRIIRPSSPPAGPVPYLNASTPLCVPPEPQTRHRRRCRWAHRFARSRRWPNPPSPPLGHPQAPMAAHWVSPSRISSEPEPPRSSPPSITVRHRRWLLHPNTEHQRVLGELVVRPDPFPGREHRRFAGVGRSRAAPTAQGPNCVDSNLSRV
jgi:hypothetical protein